MKYLLLLFISCFLLLASCNQKKQELPVCKSLKLERYKFFDDCQYAVICNGYCKECLGSYDFIKLAYEYVDTITDKKKIFSIWFLPDKIDYNNDHSDIFEIVNENAIVRIIFSPSYSHKYPKLYSMSYFINSVEYTVDFNYYNLIINKKTDTINTDSVNLKKALKELNPL